MASPPEREKHDITELLESWREGSDEAGETLMERIHRELRRIAASYLRRERPDPTLQPTAVVNEAYIRLVPQRKVHWRNRAHFYGIAAQMMRRVLVDHARKRKAGKRAHLETHELSLADEAAASKPAQDPIDILELHEALQALAEVDARQASIIEQRYFAGLSIEEIAVTTNYSPSTVKRELVAGKAWLKRYLEDKK